MQYYQQLQAAVSNISYLFAFVLKLSPLIKKRKKGNIKNKEENTKCVEQINILLASCLTNIQQNFWKLSKKIFTNSSINLQT